MNVANIFNKENYLFTNGMYPYGDKPFDNKMGASILTSTDSCRSNNRLAGLCVERW